MENPGEYEIQKLAIASLFALIVPIIGHYINAYIFVDQFPYGGYYHTATLFGSRTYQALLIVCAVGFIFGLISPKLTVWSGPKTRKTVLIVYGALLAVAFTVRVESSYLSKYIFQREQSLISKSFEVLRPGLSKMDLVDHLRKMDANIKSHYGDASPFREIADFPYKKDQFVIVFKYPSFLEKFESQKQIVVEMSANPSSENATSRRSFLISGNELLAANPPISSDEAKTYRGHIFPGVGGATFRSCNKKQLYEIEDMDQMGIDPLTEPTYVVFSGILAPGKTTSTDSKQKETLDILFVHRRGGRLSNIDGRLRLQKDANGVDQPWDCLNK